VPGVDGAAGEGDVGARDVHVAILLVDPAHLMATQKKQNIYFIAPM
jgi:hypothetical protein